MKTIILARVSTQEQKEAGNSLPAQQARLRGYIDRVPRLELDKEFIFDESAYKEHRKEFDKVIDYVSGFKEVVALCCDKVDRLTRDFLVGLPDLERLRRDGKIELHFPSDNLVLHRDSPATDLFHFNIAVSLAQYYSNAISDNTKRAFETKRRNGEWAGKPRIGYINIDLENGKKDIVPDPERGHLIQKLFELYATGSYSITTLWNKMTKMGLRGLDGQKLARSNIDLILKDPFYYGMAHSKKHGLYPHRYQALITRELFDKCQEVRSGRSKKPSKEISKPFLFKGLFTCKDCGCLYSPEMHRGITYYSCTNAKGICKRVYVPEGMLLAPIKNVFEKFRQIPYEVQKRLVSELRALNDGEAEFHNREIERIRIDYDRTQSRIQVLLDMRLDKSITSDDYDKKLQELKDKQYRLNVELDEYTKADHEYHVHVNTVLNLSRRIADIFESSEPMEKRAILGFILQNPTVSGKKLEFTMRKPFDTVLELATCPTGLRR
ncbi:MAG: hypothetical protein A3J55_01545 [Candidatus Ryanbacteria bacterium RIFCSPHIGHO2_02_FULL_45_17b]|uniref:Recombinase domain-containing protein n=1 Tax=Candidatus Ryanbacteria bacterium RIFCSPHIGHO2_01_FULL_45_22 TaxID=1802114 RepID=A0A1G2FZV0_9BACT|nr:MAG: hypothetical protein A2719_00355 [Candidatus Ryanbacteria bacterium RIFCSPHIGHO2_01_FULL_45_22]OGZ47450.1 MAG: hypothetical protein A3J55_01545 [Candidatus Ryanbacteria bacterium RIFCSPHIGHO2_02_FULL_45_17b]